MAPITLGAGEPVAPPESGPVRRGLLAAATEIPDATNGRWIGGFQWNPYTCEATDPLPIECVFDLDDKPVPDNSALQSYVPFLALGSYRCSTLNRSVDGAARARQNLAATESYQAAREWWSGAATLAADEPPANQYLADGTATELTDNPLPLLDALTLMEYSMATCLHNARGMIHVSPFLVPALDALGVLHVEGGLLVTAMDNIVVADGGYGTFVENNPAEGLAMFGTGMVYYRRGPVTPVGDEGVSFDRAKNTRTTMVERAMAVVAADCCTLLAQVDPASIGVVPDSGNVDGGTP